MTADTTALAQGFAADEGAWRALAEAALKGAPLSRLETRTADGLTVRPLYREFDFASGKDAGGYPGVEPFVRGTRPLRDRFVPWEIAQAFDVPDPDEANRQILIDLQGGATAVVLEAGPDGLVVTGADDFRRLLAGVQVGLAEVILSQRPTTPDPSARGLVLATALAEVLQGSDDPLTARVCFGLDPFATALSACGVSAGETLEHLANAVRLAADLKARFPASTPLVVDVRPVHEAGGSPAQELAVALAAGVALVRALLAAGVAREDVGGHLRFNLAVGADYLLEVAKLRALRRVWARVAEAFGLPAHTRGAVIHADTSRRMLSTLDAWNNALRATAACFAAGVGGADLVTVRPMTDPEGLSDADARRLARNTQLIAQAESGLGAVNDPVGGAWAVEAHAEDLARAAWGVFQEIERLGGLPDALNSGFVQAEVARTRAALQADVARRKQPLLGVTAFPDPAEGVPRAVPRPAVPALAESADRVVGLAAIRLAAPFEVLRAKGVAHRAKAPQAMKVFLACLGPEAEHAPRVGFIKALFAIAGFGTTTSGPDATPAQAAERFSASGSRVAVVCGEDARYAMEAEPMVKALAGTGGARVCLAGRPAELTIALSEAGVNEFIALGGDALATLELALAAAGVSFDA
jgi:methylmalonyl-CoA mutase